MEIKNAIFVNEQSTLVNVELNHPNYGWIPYTFDYSTEDSSFDSDIREYLKTATVLPYALPIKTNEQIKAEFIQSIQIMLDTKAQSKGYDNINSIAKYLGFDNKFRLECEALGRWCANCWEVAHTILLDVEEGKRQMPTIDEVLAEMPVLELV